MQKVPAQDVRAPLIHLSIFLAGMGASLLLSAADTGLGLPSTSTPWLFRPELPALPEWTTSGLAGAVLIAALLATAITVAFVAPSIRQRRAPVPRPAALSSQLAPVVPPADNDAQASRTRAIESVRDGLEAQLAELVQFVSHFLEANSQHSSTFDGIAADLANADTLEQVRAVVKMLVATSADAQRDAETLRTSLNEARAQVDQMRLRLEEAEALAAVDSLTGLANRRRLESFLAREIAASHKDKTPLCIVVTDVDHFKKINDRFGHAVGDAVLRQVATLVAGNVRPTDLAARYGGEEFVVVLPRTPLGSATFLAERIRGELGRAIWRGRGVPPGIGRVTASFGVAEIRDDETAEMLFRRADERLYAAKQNGRDRIEIDSAVG